jgi:alanine racemase
MICVERPTYVEIDLNALRHNFALAAERAGGAGRILAVVKADAYGHGATQVARALRRQGAHWFGTALLEEARELREAGLNDPILVLGGVFPGQEESFAALNLTPCIFDLEAARRLNAAGGASGRSISCHLKIDTGMGRVGFLPEDLPEVLKQLRELEHLHFKGVLSHLALADDPSSSHNEEQMARFHAVLDTLREYDLHPRHVHIDNSAALYSDLMPECTLVRPGVTLYGGYPSGHFAHLDLQPVMHWRTVVAAIKTLPAGRGVSYGHRFVTERPTRIATLPVGYADGYNRRLTGCGEVLIGGRRAPVVGTVCMDWTMVDVTDLPEVGVGALVTLLGCDGDDCIRAEEWAERIGTINYEVFCQVSKRVPRVYKE